MAASGSQTIQLYYSTSSGAAPVAGNLASGELAININDGKLYYKDSGGTVQTLATKGTAAIGGSNTQVQYNNGGSLAGSGNLTFDGTTLTAGGLSGPLNGSVGATTPSTGAFTNLSSSGTVSGTGFSNYLASPPAIGGTTPAAGSFTTLSASGNITVSGGIANGVLYLNGSKVATSGSALTYNGTTLTAVNNASAVSISLSRTSATARDYALGIDGDGGFRLTDSTGSVVILSSLPSIAFLASAGELYFKANNTEQMRLTSTGLGIGTSSPARKLHVVGQIGAYNSANDSQTLMYNNGTVGSINVTYGSTGSYLPLTFLTSDTERMRIDAAGNLGLGVTPSASWNLGKAFEIGTSTGNALWGIGINATSLLSNGYYNSGYKYSNNGYATRYDCGGGNGTHAWHIAASGTAGNAITFTQAMTLDASGRLGIGTTSPGHLLDIYGTSPSPEMRIRDATVTYQCYTNTTEATMGTVGSHPLVFRTAATERARIDSSGNLLVGTASQPVAGVTTRLAVLQSIGDYSQVLNNSNASPYGLYIKHNTDSNGAGNAFIVAIGNATTRFGVRSNGGIENYQANDVNLSDRREKTNFAPAGEYLSKICAIPVQTFNYIDQNMEEDAGLTLGVVAQDVQAVAPELVMESNWGTEEEPKMRLSIYQTDLQYALMKSIQELKAELDSVKAELAQLKGA